MKSEYTSKRALRRLQIRRTVSSGSRLNGKVLTKAAQSNSVLIKPISALRALPEWAPLWIKCAYTRELSAFLNKHNQDFPTFRLVIFPAPTWFRRRSHTTRSSSEHLTAALYFLVFLLKYKSLFFEVRKMFTRNRFRSSSDVPFSLKNIYFK